MELFGVRCEWHGIKSDSDGGRLTGKRIFRIYPKDGALSHQAVCGLLGIHGSVAPVSRFQRKVLNPVPFRTEPIHTHILFVHSLIYDSFLASIAQQEEK